MLTNERRKWKYNNIEYRKYTRFYKIGNIKGKISFNTINDYAKVLKRSFKILEMICYCLLLIASTRAGIAVMLYAYLKRQGYLITFIHVSWNVIRFFIFSFFLYGTAFRVLFLMIRDLIARMYDIFNKHLVNSTEGNFLLYKCLFTNETKFLNETIKASINSFFSQKQIVQCQDIFTKNPACTTFDSIKNKVGNETFGSFNLGFLKSDLHHLYRKLSDSSKESRKLSALSLFSAFFGVVAIYFHLLVT